MKSKTFISIAVFAALSFISCDRNVDPHQVPGQETGRILPGPGENEDEPVAPEVQISTITLRPEYLYDTIEQKRVSESFNANDMAVTGTYILMKVDVTPSDANEEIVWTCSSVDDVVTVIPMPGSDNLVKVMVADRKIQNLYGIPSSVTAASKSGGVTASFDFMVADRPVKLQKVTLNNHKIRISEDSSSSETLRFNCYPEDAESWIASSDIKWKCNRSSGLDWEYEDDACWILGGEPGIYKIILFVGDRTDECEVEVVSSKVPVTGIAVNETDLSVNEGYKCTVQADALPADATENALLWDIDDESVVNVLSRTNNTCELLARKKGTANVTISTSSGDFSKTVRITVTDPAVPDGFIDLGYRMSNGEPVFFSKKFLSDNGQLLYFAWGDPEPYIVDGVVRQGKEKGYIAENYKWYGGKTSGPWWQYKPITYPSEKNDGWTLREEDDPVHRHMGMKFYQINHHEFLWMIGGISSSKSLVHYSGKTIDFEYGDSKFSLPYLPTMRGWEECGWMTVAFSEAWFGCKVVESGTAAIISSGATPWFGYPVLPVWRGYFQL